MVGPQNLQIHPFQDGNGRVARALATLVFLKAGFLPLVIRNDMHRDRYLDALEQADKGDLAPLVRLFANIQTTDLNGAITFVREMRGEGIDVIARAAASAATRRSAGSGQLHRLTNALLEIAVNRLEAVAAEMRKAFQAAALGIDAFVMVNGSDDMGWWGQQVGFAASKHSYVAEVSAFRRWTQLGLEIEDVGIPPWYLVVSLHHKQSRADLMAAEIFLTNSAGWSESSPPGSFSTAGEWTYSAESDVALESFQRWLDQGITELLAVWQAQL